MSEETSAIEVPVTSVVAESPPQPDRIDEVESRIIAAGGAVQGFGEELPDFPVVHRFTPGLYVREIFMPAKSIVVSKIHKTEHPYVVSKGAALVYVEDDNDAGHWERIEAPHTGITKAGTRRLLAVLEDTVWLTFHPTQSTDVLEIESDIIEPHINPLLPPAIVDLISATSGGEPWPG